MAIEAPKTKQPFLFLKNSEGLNTYSGRFDRSENQCLINTNNVYTKSGTFRNRRGQVAINSTDPTGNPDSLYGLEFVRRPIGSAITRQKIVFCSDGKVYDYSTDPPTVILSGLTSNTTPDVIVVHGWLCVVNGKDTPRKYDGANWYQWGITAPVSAPTGSGGAAGSPNGTYNFRVAYRRNPLSNIDPGHVSSMGAISADVTVTNQIINLTNIPISPDPQVNARDLLVEIAGQWYIFETINDNTTTTATYDFLDSDAVQFDQGKLDRDPPSNLLTIIELHQDIVFGSDSRILNWSILDEFESFSALNRSSNAFETGDGTPIIGLRSQSDLVVGKQRSLFLRSGDDITYSVVKKITDSGVIARNSMIVKDSILYYLAHDGFRAFDGNESGLISINIHNLLFGGSTEKIVYSPDLDICTGTYYSNENTSMIIWSVPSTAAESNLALCYFTNYITSDSQGKTVNSWGLWDNLDSRFLFSAKDPTTSFDLLFSGGRSGNLRQLDTGFTDLGAPISCQYLQPDLFFGNPFEKKRMRDSFFSVSVEEGQPTGTYQVEWVINGIKSGIIKTLNFAGSAALFDSAIFDSDHFALEGDFIAITGYTSDPFYTIAPNLTWEVSKDTDEVAWNGWMVRIADAGIRRDPNTSS